MSRRIFQCVAGLVLIFATLTPLANYFDTWDQNQPPANDTELQVTALFICAGLVLVLPKLVRQLGIGAIRIDWTARSSSLHVAPCCCEWIRPEPSASPPLIPLRI